MKELKQSNNFYLIPQAAIKDSPLTIIAAPWGSGKTYFVEKLIQNWQNQKITSTFFKKAIVLDVWKFSTYKDIPNEIMKELFIILLRKMDLKYITKIKILLKKWSNEVLHQAAHFLSNWSKLDIRWKKYKDIQKSLDKINKKLKPTIVFIDNIERIFRKNKFIH